MRKLAKALFVTVGVTVYGLGGCASVPAAPTVQVVADTFCGTAKKRSWSVDDTPETIQETLRHNAGIDRACGKPAKPVS